MSLRWTVVESIASALMISTGKQPPAPGPDLPDSNPYEKNSLEVIHAFYSGIPEDDRGQEIHAAWVARQLGKIDKFKAAGILSLFRDQSPQYAGLIISKMKQAEIAAKEKSGGDTTALDSDLIRSLLEISYECSVDCSDELRGLSANPLFRSAMILSIGHPNWRGDYTLQLDEHEINFRFVAASGGVYLYSDRSRSSVVAEAPVSDDVGANADVVNGHEISQADISKLSPLAAELDALATLLMPERNSFPETEWTPEIKHVIDDIMNDFGDSASIEDLPQTEETYIFLEQFLADGKTPPENHAVLISYDKETGKYEVSYEEESDTDTLQQIIKAGAQRPDNP